MDDNIERIIVFDYNKWKKTIVNFLLFFVGNIAVISVNVIYLAAGVMIKSPSFNIPEKDKMYVIYCLTQLFY